jgi:hypothetical protein
MKKKPPIAADHARGLFQLRGDRAELGVELRPHSVDDRDDDHRNAGGDDTLFDGGGAGLIGRKSSNGSLELCNHDREYGGASVKTS